LSSHSLDTQTRSAGAVDVIVQFKHTPTAAHAAKITSQAATAPLTEDERQELQRHFVGLAQRRSGLAIRVGGWFFILDRKNRTIVLIIALANFFMIFGEPVTA
jgi:hypothetical protein